MRRLIWSDWARWHKLEKADLVELRDEVEQQVRNTRGNYAFMLKFITYLESKRFEEFNNSYTTKDFTEKTACQILDELIVDLKRMTEEKR